VKLGDTSDSLTQTVWRVCRHANLPGTRLAVRGRWVSQLGSLSCLKVHDDFWFRRVSMISMRRASAGGSNWRTV
jgi:hypothetical protein